MNIKVGSKNPTKVDAVAEALQDYELFKDATVMAADVETDPFDHPHTLAKTIEGAMKRAKAAFSECDYSFGIEGGLMEVPHTETGYMEIGACAIYDGKQYYLGLSPAHEWPKKVMELILSGMDGSQALRA